MAIPFVCLCRHHPHVAHTYLCYVWGRCNTGKMHITIVITMYTSDVWQVNKYCIVADEVVILAIVHPACKTQPIHNHNVMMTL